MPPMAGLQPLRYQKCPRTGARGSEGCFRAGVAAADDNDIVFAVRGHCSKISQFSGAGILVAQVWKCHNALHSTGISGI
jgi:hypothetical protein